MFQKQCKPVCGHVNVARRAVLFGAGATLLSACAPPTTFPITEAGQKTLIDRDVRVVQVTRDNVARLSAEYVAPKLIIGDAPDDNQIYTYRVGVGDELEIRIWTAPERTSDQDSPVAPRPVIVEEDGAFFYPFVGSVPAEGRSVASIREYLTTELSEYIAMPQVEVSVSRFVARRATLTGQVEQQGDKILTNTPIRLLSLVNQAIPQPDADLSKVKLKRRGRDYTVNLAAYIEQGIGRNPIVLPNDIITVPRSKLETAYSFGEIETQEVPIRIGESTLVSVLASSGGIDKIRAHTKGVFLFRETGTKASSYDVFQLDLSRADAYLLATQIAILPNDIIFVSNDMITRITDNIDKVLSPITGVGRAAVTGRSLAGE